MTLHHINTVARYEAKLLRRSWLFRIFAILAILGITVVTAVMQSPVFNHYQRIWPEVALSSMIPFVNVYCYNIAQSVIVIFLSGSFLKRDKKMDTAEVIYVRPMSNADYILGKTWGILRVFLSLNLVSLAVAAFFNLAVTRSPFSLFPYFFYLLTISLPSLLFVLGLSFTAMSLLKNQAVTFIVMLGLTGTAFFYLRERLYGAFDFFGVNIPSLFSDVTGQADLRLFLLQRTGYFLLGTGFILLTIGLVTRLPHKPRHRAVVRLLGVCCLLAGCGAGLLYVMHYRQQRLSREAYAATFNRYAEASHAALLSEDITVTPLGNRMTATAALTVANRQAETLDSLILYLNPGLEVSSAEADGQAVPFRRENQVILLGKTLPAGDSASLLLRYEGRIDETLCYTDIPDKDYFDTRVSGEPFRFGKRYAWLEDRFTLLTPECLWYPTAVPPVHPASPYQLKKNFVRYTLTVDRPDGKTALSQGDSREEEGRTVFTNRNALPGISLAIADYERKHLRVDSVDYEILHFKGHDYFSRHFASLRDTLPGLIREVKNELETGSKGRDYPFRKFVLAETPVQFAGYLRSWKGHTEYVQPEIVFIPERGATLKYDFETAKKQTSTWGRRGERITDETEVAGLVFRDFVRRALSDEETPYDITPLFFQHTGFVRSEEYPVLDAVVNLMQNPASLREKGSSMFYSINARQRANLYLENHSLETALSDAELKQTVLHELLKLKSNALRNYLLTRIPAEELDPFLKEFFRTRRFTDIPFRTFEAAFEKRFSTGFDDYLRPWYTEDHTPSLIIRDVDAMQAVAEEETRYQVRFKVNNPSDADALITATLARGGESRGRGWRNASGSPEPSETYLIPKGEAREIRIITDRQPAGITVNTNISHNLPNSQRFNFPKIDRTTEDTLAGIFPIDPAAFRPNAGEIVIDNEDAGFTTRTANTRHKLKDLFKKNDGEKYRNFTPWWVPSQWTAIASESYYGEIVHSAVYKKKGAGNNSAVWTADIPRSGNYEVSVWNPKPRYTMYIYGRHNRPGEDRKQTYLLQYGSEKEAVTVDLGQEDEGWISLGNFHLPQGAVSVTLTDKVSGGYVIADAVRFLSND